MKFHFIASENPEAKEALKVLINRYDQTKLELSDVIIAVFKRNIYVRCSYKS